MNMPEAGALADRPHTTVRRAPVEPVTVSAAQGRSFVSLADREINGARIWPNRNAQDRALRELVDRANVA